MVKLIGISGSLRRGSFNTALVQAAAKAMPGGSELVVKTLHGVPLYDGDIESAEGIPPAAAALKEAIVAADGVLLVTPEYNNGIPGVFKNAIDWISRPSTDIKRVFANKPFALMGASPGNFGTTLSQTAWLPVLRTLGTHAWFGDRLMVSRAPSVFDTAGVLTDAAIQEHLKRFMLGFVNFVERSIAANRP
jgi:chromate reductase, NAD(P)H dehydrogenase (quinone)